MRAGLVVSLLVLSVLPGAALAAPSVAVLDEPGFPYFAGYAGLAAPDMVAYLQRLGLSAQGLSARELADPAVFNAERYYCLVHIYGNCFPLAAAQNVQAFRKAGGGLIGTVVPFCHPCVQPGVAEWTAMAQAADQVERRDDPEQAGNACLMVAKTSPLANWVGAVSTRVPVRAGETVRIAARVRTEGGLGTRETDCLYVRFFAKGGTFLGQWGPPFPPPAPWRRVSHEVVAPAGAEEMDICPALWATPATLWLDDVTLECGDRPGENLAPNGSFAATGGAWKDLGHVQKWVTHEEGLAMGGFHTPGPARGGLEYHGDVDPLGLRALDWARWRGLWERLAMTTQTLDPGTLPALDEVVNVLSFTEAGQSWPVIAVVRHHCAPCKGAVDVWAGGQLFATHGVQSPVDQREVVARAAVYIGAEKGVLAHERREAILATAAALYQRDQPRKGVTLPEEAKPTATVFPQSPRPSARLSVADIRFAATDEKLLLTTLQGLVNRTLPRLYYVASVVPGDPPVDEQWLAWLQERGDVTAVDRVASPRALLATYRDVFRGLVVYDPAVPATVNVATSMAALENVLAASPRLADELKLPVVADLRGRWLTNAAALGWAVAELWPKMNQRLLATNAPGWPLLADYLVAHRVFSFWITGPVDGRPPVGSPLAEQLVIDHLLARTPANVGLIGAPWNGDNVGIQEGMGVSLFSRYGKFLSWSADVPNLTVHSGAGARQPFRHLPAAPLQLDRSKVYLAMMVSDGDAPINWAAFFRTAYWNDPVRGQFPLTWSVGPTVFDLIPDIMDYVRDRASVNDCFVTACSGVGYCYPDVYGEQLADPQGTFDGFVKRTGEYMEQHDLHGLWTHTASGAPLREFAARIPVLRYALPDYGRAATTTAGNAIAVLPRGVPAFHAVTSFNLALGQEATMKLMLDDLRAYTPPTRPAFMHAFVQCYPWTPTRLQQVLEQLGPEYVPVRADELGRLWAEAGNREP
jgi:hypothetical protein